jgi:arylsulfatase A-like enzyme
MCLTHGPQERTPDTIDKEDKHYDRGEVRFRYAVEYMDKLVGRITDALDAMDLRENTIVLFTSDNGTAGGGKAEPTELGARVPLIVNAPGIVKTRGATGRLSDLTDVFSTLADFAGAPQPDDRPIDGVSLKPFLTGASEETRPWIHSFIADRRLLRTERYLLEDNSPMHYGRLYDCGDSRDGSGYQEVTHSEDPEVLTIKEEFNRLLDKLPAPIIEEPGHPRDMRREKQQARQRRGTPESPLPPRESRRTE